MHGIPLQGMGVGILQKDIATQAFEEALRKVVTEPRYTAAARKVSQKLRARKRTPVEEAAGKRFHFQSSHGPSSTAPFPFAWTEEGTPARDACNMPGPRTPA